MIQHQIPLELLRPPSGKCLGAVFCTYAFDERFFDSVLAALLPIHADPESDPHMFVSEARRRLRETPVVVMTDGNSYAGGHRLPFQLILSPAHVALHVRLSLILFENHARLTVGSANVTPTSFGESADLCGVLRLDYHKDSALFTQTIEMLEAAGAQGEGWLRFVRQCRTMLGGRGKPAQFPRLHASKPDSSMVCEFLSFIPKAAKIDGVHLMASTQPEDDAHSGKDVLEPLRSWMKTKAKKVPLNLAIAWADANVTPPAEQQTKGPEKLAGFLCAEIQGLPGAETIAWSPLEKIEGSKLFFQGRKQPVPVKAVVTAMHAESPKFWAVEDVTGVGLLEAIEPLGEALDVNWWLFPEAELHRGQVRRRPFHAKLLAVCTTEAQKPFTHVLLNWPNFVRRVAADEQTFEVGLHLRLSGHCQITDLCPELFPAPTEGFFLEDRSWIPRERKPKVPLERATYDARSHTLVLEWQPRAPECSVLFQRDEGEEEILKERPGLRTTCGDFVLGPMATELRVVWEDKQAFVPITVANISCLCADEPEHALRLVDIVAWHLGRRALGLSSQGPSAWEVFQAQHALVDQLVATGSLLGAFEVAMDGPVGLHAFADALLCDEASDRGVAWILGLELIKLVQAVDWTKEVFGDEKQRVTAQFARDYKERLEAVAPGSTAEAEIAKYYGGRS